MHAKIKDKIRKESKRPSRKPKARSQYCMKIQTSKSISDNRSSRRFKSFAFYICIYKCKQIYKLRFFYFFSGIIFFLGLDFFFLHLERI
jgi:hypothetical protein